jgi:hypothetical protein
MMPDESVEPLLDELRHEIGSALGTRLVGLYLYGSHVTGGSLVGVSDLDLLAATNGDLTFDELDRLKAMHASFVERHPKWRDRIEVAYLSTDALASFKERRSQIAVISPGEPLHFRDEGAGADWLMNWHLVRTGGRTVHGPEPESLIAPTKHEEFVESLREHIRMGEPWAAHARTRKGVSYVSLTLCRTLVAVKTGRHSSKPEAAEWVKHVYPRWAALVDWALAARIDPDGERPAGASSIAEMRAFFDFVRKSL